MDYFKDLKERPISIGEFEDLWERNNRLDVAEKYLQLLRDAPKIELAEKVEFLAKILKSAHDSLHRSNVPYIGNTTLIVLTIGVFLELVSQWDDNFSKECWLVVDALKDVSQESQCIGKKVKTFVQSLLNTKRKEDTHSWKYVVHEVMIEHGMLEELVNYNFTSEYVVHSLTKKYFGYDSYLRPDDPERLREFGELIAKAIKENREPHALSVLLRILGKREDLEQIFKVEAETKNK